MRKKLLALVLSMTMVVGLMTGCGGNSSGGGTAETGSVSGETETKEIGGITYNVAKDLTEDDIELTYFHFDQKETVELLVNRFMEIYPNIKVNPVYEPVKTYNDTLTQLVSNGTAPDVTEFHIWVLHGHSRISAYIQNLLPQKMWQSELPVSLSMM